MGSRSLTARALRLLDEAAKAGARLPDSEDAEALHDFRVALRRLLGHLKAYRRDLGAAAGGKARRRLRRLFDKTSPLRDVETERVWVRERLSGAEPALLAGLESLEIKLSRKYRRVRSEMEGELVRRFWKLEDELRKRLKEAGGSFGRAAAQAARAAISERAEKLGRLLHGLGGRSDPRLAHKLRIAAKNLRYLLEPFKKHGLVDRLKEAQRLLGDIHDRTVFLEAVGGEFPEVAGLLEAELRDLRKEFAGWLDREREALPAAVRKLGL